MRWLKIASWLGFNKFLFQRLLLSDLYPGSMIGEEQSTGQHLPMQDIATAGHDDTKL